MTATAARADGGRIAGVAMTESARFTRALPAVGGLALIVALGGAVAVAAPEATTAGSSTDAGVVLAVEKYALPNGLEVILSPDPKAATVATNTWYHVGAADEGPGQTGFAHLFEHMMFEGSGHVPEGDLDTLTEKFGAYTNASTDFDATNYLIPDLPPEQLELGLWLESDRMGFLLDRLDARSLANQVAVVRNERRQNSEQAPYALTRLAIFEQLFPSSHPYFGDVIGSHADIQASELKDVREFFRTYYVPNNATLAIAGNFDPARARTLIEKYFGTLAGAAEPPAPDALVPRVEQEKRVRLTDDVELPKVTMAWLTPPAFKPGDAEADVTAQILAGGESSILYSTLVRDLKLAQSVEAYQESHTYPSIFQIEAVAKPGHTAAELEKEIDAVLTRLRDAGPEPRQVNSAQVGLVADLVRGVEGIGGFNERADTLNRYNHYVGDPDYLKKDIARYRAVDAAAVQMFARDQLRTDARVVAHTVPGKKKLPPDPTAPAKLPEASPVIESAELWRNTVPAAGPDVPRMVPGIASFTLANGLRVFTVPIDGLPLVTSSLVSLHGSSSDPARLPGLAELTARVLREGDRTRTASQTAETVADLGAQLTAAAGRDGSAVTMQTLTPQASDGLALLAALVRAPGLRAEDIDRIRGDLLVELGQREEEPESTAWALSQPALYGAGHPYGHLPAGTEKGVKAITGADLTRFHELAYTPGTSALVLAGDVSGSSARSLAEDAFGSWSGTAELPRVPSAPAATPGLVLIDVPGASQTAVEISQPGLPRQAASWDTARVGNQILGGLFSSRLNSNLREDKGYAYGAYSDLAGDRGPAPFDAYASVETRHTGSAIREFFAEFDRIRSTPAPTDEFERGRQSLTASVAQLFATTSVAASTAATLFQVGLPPEHFDSLAGRLGPLTPESVRAAMRSFLLPGRMTVVAVGDLAAIGPQLAKLDLGPVTYVKADGTPSKRR